MTWFGEKIERKRDVLTDAMEGFWGAEPKQDQGMVQVRVAPSMVNPTGTMMAIEVPNDENYYNIMSQTGNTIKEQVEQNVNATQDLTPDVRAGVQYMGPAPIQQVPQKQGNIYDLGGFDAMISKQLARERGSFGLTGNMGLGLGMGGQSRAAMERDIERLNIMRMKQAYQEQRKAAQMASMDFARQSQSRAMAERANIGLIRQVAESGRMKARAEARVLEEAAAAERRISKATVREKQSQVDSMRAAAGLPVYSSFWDSIAGGKRIIRQKKYDAKGHVIEEGSKIVREGGLFGAFRNTIGFAENAGRQLDEFQETTRQRAEQKRLRNEELERKKIESEINRKRTFEFEKAKEDMYKSPFSSTTQSPLERFFKGGKSNKKDNTIDDAINEFMGESSKPKEIQYEPEINNIISESNKRKERNPFEFTGGSDIIDKGIKESTKLENSYSPEETDEKLINDIMSK